MSGRKQIANTFRVLEKQNRAGLVCFTTAGYPDMKQSQDILTMLAESGCDIIELGIPFSDPMADGPVIQRASRSAIKAGCHLGQILEQVNVIRNQGIQTPIVLMGYYNPLLRYGEDRFAREAADVGVDGLIVVDTPPEEDATIREAVQGQGLAFVRLATPTSDTARLKKIVADADGYLYYVAVAGITGTKQASSSELQQAANRLRHVTDLPIAAGFGIRTPRQVSEIADYFDAIVCGSALLQSIADDRGPRWTKTASFVRNMANATQRD